MKNFITIAFSFLLFNCFAQSPVMNPIAGPSVACSSPSSPMSFTASASNSPTSYSWSVASPSTGVVIMNPSSAVTSISFPYSNGTYTLYCSATNGFSTSPTESFVVTVFETPSVSFSGSNTFCQGSSTNLSASSTILAASPTIFYNWSPSYGLNTTVGPNVIANPAITPINYTVTATKGPCSNTAQITVIQLSAPSVTALTTHSSVCFGHTTSVNGAGANSYTWSGNVTDNVPFTPLSSNIYFVTGTGSNGCTKTASVSVTVNPLPNYSVISTTSLLCKGQTATLSLTGNATSYSLNSTPTATAIVISPTITTSYTFTARNSFGCDSIKVFTQNVTSCAGIQSNSISSDNYLKVFPNPNNGVFHLRSGIKETVLIINEIGETVEIIELKPDTDHTVSGLSAGIYLIQTNTSTTRIIITN